MLKFRVPEIVLGFLFGIAVFSVVVALSSLRPSSQSEGPEAHTEQKSQGGGDQQNSPAPLSEIPRKFIFSVVQIVADGLQKTANYCTNDGTTKEDKWLQDFLCGIKITDVIIAIFSVLLVFVTIGLVIVGYVQARRMRVSARQQLRAYVFVENVSILNITTPLAWEVAPSYKPTGAEITHTHIGPIVLLAIKNTGQTPAYKVINWADIEIREFPLKSKLRNSRRSLFVTKSSIGAGGTSTKNLPMTVPLNADQVADLKRGTAAIYVFGYISYRDAFRRKRRTNYRFMYGIFTGGIGITTSVTIADDGNGAN